MKWQNIYSVSSNLQIFRDGGEATLNLVLWKRLPPEKGYPKVCFQCAKFAPQYKSTELPVQNININQLSIIFASYIMSTLLNISIMLATILLLGIINPVINLPGVTAAGNVGDDTCLQG
jgi:hypothetical protein